MSHTYLLDLYELIDTRLREAEALRQEAAADSLEAVFQKGRLETLRECRQFLADHYNHKLPRRLQSKYSRLSPE